MNKTIVSAKNFYVKHERKILITTTVAAIGAAAMMKTGITQHNDFLKEHGLFDAFYTVADN